MKIADRYRCEAVRLFALHAGFPDLATQIGICLSFVNPDDTAPGLRDIVRAHRVALALVKDLERAGVWTSANGPITRASAIADLLLAQVPKDVASPAACRLPCLPEEGPQCPACVEDEAKAGAEEAAAGALDASPDLTAVAMVLSAWNTQCPIGTPVSVCLEPDAPELRTKTRSAAWLAHGMPLVFVEGLAGGVPLDNVRALSRGAR